MGIWRLLLLILFFDAIFKVMVAGVMYSSPGDLVFGKGDSTRVGRVKGQSYRWQHRQLTLCFGWPFHGDDQFEFGFCTLVFSIYASASTAPMRCPDGRRMNVQLSWRPCVIHVGGKGDSTSLPGSEESKVNRTYGITGNSHCASAGGSMGMISPRVGSVL